MFSIEMPPPKAIERIFMSNSTSPADFASMIDYQADTVASKTIIKKDSGSVTLFSFDRGQGLSEHTAPFDALVHVVDGTAEVNISGTPHRLDAGDMIVMPAGEPHALHAVERFKMILSMIRS